MVRAIWNNQVVAESDECVEVEGNQYFPPEAVRREFLEPSQKKSDCAWKGRASYYHVNIDGKRNDDAAWYYPEPKEAAARIRDHIAFWKGVKVERG